MSNISNHISNRYISEVMDLMKANRLLEAEKKLLSIINSWPQMAQASYMLGVIKQRQGEMEEAVQLYEQALSVRPDFEQVRQALVQLNALIEDIGSWEAETDSVYCYWYKEVANWGDALNKSLVEELSGKQAIWAAPFDYRVKEKYFVIGSILNYVDANTVVWGSGAISARETIVVSPRRICAVRGPLTRQKILDAGLDCPDVYGDPALLLPRFYDKPVEQTYEIGVIAHYVDQQLPWLQYAREQGARIINILDDIHSVVDATRSCKLIASSSLHGMILADSYGIPSTWLEFSGDVYGDGFKFRDYFSSVGRPVIKPLKIEPTTSIEDVYSMFTNYNIDIDLDRLYQTCPFLK